MADHEEVAGRLPLGGGYVERGGRRFRVLFGGDDFCAIAAPHDRGLFPDALELGDRRGETWVKLRRPLSDPAGAVEVVARWRGLTVSVRDRVRDGRIRLTYLGPPGPAREAGMDGDRHLGWEVLADPDEIEVTRVTETPEHES